MSRFLLVAALALTGGSAAADPAAVLRAALAAVPQVADSGLGPAFADVGAAAKVLEQIDLAPYHDFLSGPLGPLSLATPLARDPEPMLTAVQAWPRLVGFGPADIATVVNYGTPPDQAVRIALVPGVAGAVPPALTANGYNEATTPFGPLFLRGTEDYGLSFTTRNPDDPFGGMLGQASRVLVQGDVLTRAAGMPPLEAAMNGPFWGDRGDLAALLDVLSAQPADTVILRAQILTDQTAFMGGQVTAATTAVLEGKTPVDALDLPENRLGIPPWSLGLIADVVQGATPGVIFAFVYATDLQAREAAQAVETGWRVPAPVTGTAPATQIGPAVTAVAGDGPFVLTVSVIGAWSSEGVLANMPFRQAYAAFMQRDLPVFGLPM